MSIETIHFHHSKVLKDQFPRWHEALRRREAEAAGIPAEYVVAITDEAATARLEQRRSSLRGSVAEYKDPFEPVALEDWGDLL